MVAYDQDGNPIEERSAAPLVAGAALGAAGAGALAYRGIRQGASSIANPLVKDSPEALVHNALRKEYFGSALGNAEEEATKLKESFLNHAEQRYDMLERAATNGHDIAVKEFGLNSAVDGKHAFLESLKEKYDKDLAKKIEFNPMHEMFHPEMSGGELHRYVQEQLKAFHNVPKEAIQKLKETKIKDIGPKEGLEGNELIKVQKADVAHTKLGAKYAEAHNELQEMKKAYVKGTMNRAEFNRLGEYELEAAFNKIPNANLVEMEEKTIGRHLPELERSIAQRAVQKMPHLKPAQVSENIPGVTKVLGKMPGGAIAKTAAIAAVGGVAGAWALNTMFGKKRTQAVQPPPPQAYQHINAQPPLSQPYQGM